MKHRRIAGVPRLAASGPSITEHLSAYQRELDRTMTAGNLAALEREARGLALEARARVQAWPRYRRVFWWRTLALTLTALALALWAWPLLVIAAVAAACSPSHVRRWLRPGTRADLARRQRTHAHAIEVHDRVLTMLLEVDPRHGGPERPTW